MIFKKNQSKRFHITSIVIGVLFVRTGIIAYAFAHTHAQRGNPGRKRNQQRFGLYRYPECIRGLSLIHI